MLTFFSQFNPVFQALLATFFAWGMTAVGAASIFLTKEINRKLLDILLGFAAGVMIAASYWSLLAPAIEIGNSIGFMAGGLVLFGIDKILPHLHLYLPKSDAEGIKTTWHKQILLMLAITIHNLPEGLAVGVAFGAAAAGIHGASLAGAIVLAIGMGLQNLPEGIAVAAPLHRDGVSRLKSFWYGQLSAIVEPIGGVLGAAAVIFMRNLMPYALSFAAGAMIYVVIEELIPESQHCENSDAATLGALIGFTLMMILDVAFGG
jgi:ZIP family zinc transporter